MWQTNENGHFISFYLFCYVRALTSGSGVAVALLLGASGPLIGVAISASLLPPVVNCVSILQMKIIDFHLLDASTYKLYGVRKKFTLNLKFCLHCDNCIRFLVRMLFDLTLICSVNESLFLQTKFIVKHQRAMTSVSTIQFQVLTLLVILMIFILFRSSNLIGVSRPTINYE